MSAVASHAANNTGVTNAVSEVGTVFRGLGAGFPKVLKDVGSEITTTLTNTPKAVGDKIMSLPNDILNVPIAPDLSLPKLSKIIQKGDTDSVNKALENITGIKIHDVIGTPQGTATVNVQKRLDDYMAAIKRQILDEIKNCIERWLQHLNSKNPIIGILLDLEGYIQRRISKYRLALQRRIRSEIEKMAHEKLKLWQIATLRQKILQYVRQICPDTHTRNIKTGNVGSNADLVTGNPLISPTMIQRLQTDNTWSLADGSTPIPQSARDHGGESMAWADSDNNTGQVINNLVAAAVKELENDIGIQSLGYSGLNVDTFVSNNGTINSEYVNSEGKTVSQTKSTELEICID